MIKDQNIAGKLIRKYIPVQAMAGWDATQQAALGAGLAIYQEILAATEVAGMQIGAAGDEIYDFFRIWDKLDRDDPIQARIHFFTTSATADNPDWVATLKGLAYGVAITDAKVTPDALFTFPAKATAGVANALNMTDWVKVDGPIFASTDIMALMSIECNGLGAASANELTLAGIEFAFTAKRTVQNNRRERAIVLLPNDLP